MNRTSGFVYHQQNPYPAYAWLRSRTGPYFHEPEQTWLVSRYDQVAFVLRDSRFSKELPKEDQSPLSNTMLFQDPPNHRRLRDAVAQAFAAQSPKRLQNAIYSAADGLIDRIESQSSVDFIQQYASPLPIAVMAEMLGITSDFFQRIHDWTEALVRAGVPGEKNPKVLLAGSEAVQAMGQFFSSLTTENSSVENNNLLSALVHPTVDLPHGPLTNSELAGTCMLLMIAGHETTVNLLGNCLYLLLSHPAQLSYIEADPGMLLNAIEETLRFESPVQRGTYRCTKEPVRIGDVMIPACSNVTALIGAANRDPDIFDHPDTFDITRKSIPHLGFGQGVHFCLGASLAREEASIALTRLFMRLPSLRLQEHAPCQLSRRRRVFNTITGRLPNLFAQKRFQPCWDPNTIVRGLTSLPVEWGT